MYSSGKKKFLFSFRSVEFRRHVGTISYCIPYRADE